MHPTLRKFARRPLVRLGVTAAIASGLLVGAACGQVAAPPDPWSHWTRLELKARAAPLFRGEIEMRLTEDGRRLETLASARLFGARLGQSQTVSLFDAETGRVRRFSTFSSRRGRRYEFGESGYVMEKLTRSGDAANDAWTVTLRKEFDYPVCPDSGKPLRVFDYYGMLLHLREAGLDEPGDEVELLVATSDGPQPYRIRVDERRQQTRTLNDLADGGRKTMDVEEFRLRVSPSDPDNGEAGFIGMEGETELWVEARSKTLLEISGKVPKVPGRVRIKLDGMRAGG